MIVTIFIPAAGSRKLGNRSAHLSSRTAASSSARASSSSEHVPSAKSESSALTSTTVGQSIRPAESKSSRDLFLRSTSSTKQFQQRLLAIRCCDANVAVQTGAYASLRFSFCNFVANCIWPVAIRRLRGRHLRSFTRSHSGKSLEGVLERSGTPIAKLLNTTTLTAPSGASREKNEGRGCLAEGASCAG